MKKLTALVLAILMALGCASFVASAKETAEVADMATLLSGSLLPNTYAKMRKGEAIHIGYFGGSVTNGYGASSQAGTSWRGLSLKWLNDTYASTYGCSFYEGTHAGLGGSGTDLNVYRADHALGLDGNDPVDLLFIEFAINDSYEGNSYDKSAYYLESIIRTVRTKAPECDIVVCLTTDFGKKDTEYTNARAHSNVAAYYSVPTMWFGKRMWAFLTEENGGTPVAAQTVAPWTTYYQDGCHPNDNGYQKYFEFLRDDILKPNLDTNASFSTAVVNHTMPDTYFSSTLSASSEYYNKTPLFDAYYVTAGNATGIENAYNFNVDNTITANGGGASFSAVFHSKSAGMYYQGDPTNGLIQYSVDGGDYQIFNMHTSASAQNEYFMFYKDLEYGEHTVDVILRATESGADFKLRAFFIDGDLDKQGVTITGAPNKKPLNDVFFYSIVLTPPLLNTKISGGGTTNNGSSFSVIHHHTDVDVLQYVPNPSSSNDIASDCYNSTFTSVSLPRYRYAVMHYYYEIGEGDTAHNNRPLLRMIRLPNASPNNLMLYSADKLVLNESSDAIFDLTALNIRLGAKGNLVQMHVYPYGSVKGNQLSATELMNIRDITFYAEWPYDESVTVDAENMSLNATQQSLSLEGKKILPSAFPYAMITYSYDGTAAQTIDLDFTNLNYGSDIHAASKPITSGTDNTVVVNLEQLSRSGQIYYLDDVKLSAATGSGETLTVSQIEFCTNYPDKNATFTVSFDINGATGTAPAPVSGKIGTNIELPDGNRLLNPGYTFLGWNTDPSASTALSSYFIPEDGATLYAIWKPEKTAYVNADGSGTLVYRGESHTAYTTLVEAITALGAEGGSIVFTGTHVFEKDVASAVKAAAPIYKFIGADDEAKLQISRDYMYYQIFKTNVQLQNLTLVAPATGGKYIGPDCGKTLTIGSIDPTTGLGANDVRIVTSENGNPSQVFVYGNPGWGAAGDLVINSGRYDKVSGSYGNVSGGNTHVTINGGTMPNSIVVGAAKVAGTGTYTHKGNITFTLNGGTYNKTQHVQLSENNDRTTTVTGKTSVILNNDLASSYNFVFTDIDYVLKSAVGGTVELSAEATANTAPTFVIVPDAADLFAVVNGEELEKTNGKSFFTPDEKGTYEITYVQHEILIYFKVGGSVVTQRPNGKAPLGYAQVRVYKDGEKEARKIVDIEDADTKTGKVDFEFEVTPGKYTVEFRKNGYLACFAPLNVNDRDVAMGTFTLIPGDVKASANDFDGDGTVDLNDFVRVLRGLDFASLRGFVDIDEDGAVTVTDIGFVKAAFGKTSETAYAD